MVDYQCYSFLRYACNCWLFFCLEHDSWIIRFTGCGLYGCCGFVVILCLLLIFGIADSLPVVSWVLLLKSLTINTIHFSGMYAFSGWVSSGVGGNDCFDNREIM